MIESHNLQIPGLFPRRKSLFRTSHWVPYLETGFLVSYFSFGARKNIVQAVILSVIDYSDILYMHANSSSLKMLDHVTIRFVSDSGFRTHHCKLYEKVGLSSLSSLYPIEWNTGICFFIRQFCTNCLLICVLHWLLELYSMRITRSSSFIMYNVPQTRTTCGESAFKSFAPSLWCKLQDHLNWNPKTPLTITKTGLRTI